MKHTWLTLLSTCLLAGPTWAQFDVNNIDKFRIQRNLSGDKLSDLHTGDFNNDGKPDILIDGGLDMNNSNYIEFNSKPVFFLGDGQGNFTQATSTFTHPGNSSFICDIADYNNDQYDDLLVADFWGNGMRLYKGGPNLSFTLAQNLGTGTHGAKGYFVDIDNDGDLDIVNVSSGSAALVAMHVFHQNAGTFTKSSYDAVASADFFQADRGFNPVVLITDINRDSRLDVLSISSHKSPSSGRMNTWVQNPNKTFTAGVEPTPADMYDVYNDRFVYWNRDINGDGFSDLLYFYDLYAAGASVAVAYGEAQSPYFGDSIDTQSEPVSGFLGYFLQQAVRADVDNDGTEDIVTYNRDNDPERLLTVITDPFDDNGNFAVQTLNLGMADIERYGQGLMLADLDNDNDPELVSLGRDDTLRIFGNPTLVAGIAEAKKQPGFTLYPNPTVDYLRMAWPEGEAEAVTAVKIYDGAGRLVQAYTNGEWGKPLPVAALAAGRYLIFAETAKGSTGKMFIKN